MRRLPFSLIGIGGGNQYSLPHYQNLSAHYLP